MLGSLVFQLFPFYEKTTGSSDRSIDRRVVYDQALYDTSTPATNSPSARDTDSTETRRGVVSETGVEFQHPSGMNNVSSSHDEPASAVHNTSAR